MYCDFQSKFFCIITPVAQSFQNHSDSLLKKTKTFIISMLLKTAEQNFCTGFFDEQKRQKNSIYLK